MRLEMLFAIKKSIMPNLKTMISFRFFVILFFCLIHHGIILSQKIDTTGENKKFVVLTLKITKEGDNYEFTQTALKLVNGVYKRLGDGTDANHENNFVVSILNGVSEEIASFIIENPIGVALEHPSDSGKMKYSAVNINETEILVRFNYSDDMKKISIKKFGSESALTNPTTLYLDFK